MASARLSTRNDLTRTLIGGAFILAGFYLTGGDGGDVFYGTTGLILIGGLTSIIGYIKHRNPVAWFAIGYWSFYVGVIIALIVPRLAEALCPLCREAVEPDATICPHCQREIAGNHVDASHVAT